MKKFLVLFLFLAGCSTVKPYEYNYISQEDKYVQTREYFFDKFNSDGMSIYYENDRSGEMVVKSDVPCLVPGGKVLFTLSSLTRGTTIKLRFDNLKDKDHNKIPNKHRVEVEKCLSTEVQKYLQFLNTYNSI